MITRTSQPASGAMLISEMKEFASFPKATQRYIRRSLDVAYGRRDAIECWARDEGEAASIRAINHAAGLGPASVHYHFGSKDALLEAVLLDQGLEVRADPAAHTRARRRGRRADRARTRRRARAAYLEQLEREPTRGRRRVRMPCSRKSGAPTRGPIPRYSGSAGASRRRR